MFQIVPAITIRVVYDVILGARCLILDEKQMLI